MIKDFKKQLLEQYCDNYNFSCMKGEEVTLAHYVCNEANNDAGFFRWLFDNDELSDFECENNEEFRTFVASIKTHEDNDDFDVNFYL